MNRLESAELRPLVVGFENAGIGHGGQGALYVRVRRGLVRRGCRAMRAVGSLPP